MSSTPEAEKPQPPTASASSATTPATSSTTKRKFPALRHKYEKRRLTKAQWRKRAEVCAKFLCPFTDKCKLGEKCFFSHNKAEEDSQKSSQESSIKKLPTYCCVSHITGGCCQIPYPRKNAMRMRCPRGFHMSFEDLDNLTLFEETHSAQLKDEMCPVCFEHMTLTNKESVEGHMVNCRHVFCLKCITECFKSKPECPLCRTAGPFIASATKPKTKDKQKALKKFKKQRRNGDHDDPIVGGQRESNRIVENIQIVLGDLSALEIADVFDFDDGEYDDDFADEYDLYDDEDDYEEMDYNDDNLGDF